MRRRDATHNFTFTDADQRWSALVSTIVSVALHTILLAVAVGIVVSRDLPHQLIRVTIAAGGGNGAARGGSAGAGPLQPGLAPPAAAPKAPQVQAPRVAKPAPRAIAKAPPPAARRAVGPANDVAARAPDATDTATTVGDAGASGGTQGNGDGLASGSGTGIGGGAGGGSGGGRGGGDQRAQCIYCPEPQYPAVARRRGWQGTVYVGLSVLADGTVQEASLSQSSGYSVLDDAAVEVARRSRFTSPLSLGLAAPLRGRIEYRFELSAAH